MWGWIHDSIHFQGWSYGQKPALSANENKNSDLCYKLKAGYGFRGEKPRVGKAAKAFVALPSAK
jgi:hypothetical protein